MSESSKALSFHFSFSLDVNSGTESRLRTFSFFTSLLSCAKTTLPAKEKKRVYGSTGTASVESVVHVAGGP